MDCVDKGALCSTVLSGVDHADFPGRCVSPVHDALLTGAVDGHCGRLGNRVAGLLLDGLHQPRRAPLHDEGDHLVLRRSVNLTGYLHSHLSCLHFSLRVRACAC